LVAFLVVLAVVLSILFTDWILGLIFGLIAVTFYLSSQASMKRNLLASAQFFDQYCSLRLTDGSNKELKYSDIKAIGIQATTRMHFVVPMSTPRVTVYLYVTGERTPFVLHGNPKNSVGIYLHPWLLQKGIPPVASLTTPLGKGS